VLKHTNRKVMLTHTLHYWPRKELNGCLANIRVRMFQMVHNGRIDLPNIPLVFSYKNA